MIERVEFKSESSDGKVDATGKKGRVFARVPANATVGDGIVLSPEVVDQMVRDFEEIPVRTKRGYKAGTVVDAMKGTNGDLVLDIRMDEDAFPDLWRGISSGCIYDFSMDVSPSKKE